MRDIGQAGQFELAEPVPDGGEEAPGEVVRARVQAHVEGHVEEGGHLRGPGHGQECVVELQGLLQLAFRRAPALDPMVATEAGREEAGQPGEHVDDAAG